MPIAPRDEGTESEKRVKYELFKKAGVVEPYLWDAWLNMELSPAEPRPLIRSNIMTVQVKNLLRYCSPLFEGDPHVASRTDKPGAVWLQYDKDLRALDMSFREYRIPKDEKFRVSGIHLWYRRHGGAYAPDALLHRNTLQTSSDIVESGQWSFWHPDGVVMGCRVTPLPFPAGTKILFESKSRPEDLDTLIDEINKSNMWYFENESLIYSAVDIPAIIAIRHAWSGLEPTKDAVAKKIQPYMVVQFGSETLLFDINQVDLLDFYHRARLLGVTNPAIVKQIVKIETASTDMALIKQHRFNSQMLTKNETLKNAIAQQVTGKSFRELSKTERAQVLKLYETKRVILDDREVREFIRKLHRAFDATVTDTFEMQRVHDEYKRKTGAVATAEPKDFVRFKTGAGSLCPHYVQIMRETLRAPLNALGQIDTQAVTQKIVQRWAEKVQVNYKYYCSKCGELLMTEDMDDFIVFNQTVISSTSDKDPLWYYIMSEVNQIVRRVKFTKPPNLKTFTQTVSQTLESEMTAKQIELQKSKTKSLEDIRNIMIIYISAYCFALLSHMMIDHPNMLKWNVHLTKTGGKVKSKQTDALQILSIAYSLLIDSNQNRITKIKDFSIDQIKPILLHGYEWARNVKFAAVPEERDAIGMEWATLLYNDPWYNLLYDMQSVRANVKYTDFERILGSKDPRDMLCSEKPFAKTARPDSKDYFVQCYTHSLDYVDLGIFREIAVPRSPVLHAWHKQWNFLLEEDDQRDRVLRMFALRPCGVFYDNAVGQVPQFPKLDISLVKCPDGRRHEFGLRKMVYVFQNGKKMTLQEIIKLSRENNKAYKALTLKDELCGNCGMSAHAHPAKIQTKLEETINRHNFYKYFENRCPVGDLHEFPVDRQGFIGKQNCKRCGFSKTFLDEQPTAYFKRYISKMPKFEKRSEVLKLDRFVFVQKKQEKWNVTLTSILQIANASGVPYNIWINLGLSEHRNFNLLRLGKINPQSTLDEAASAARLTKLANYVHFVFNQYMLVRNHSRIAVPIGLKAILEGETVDVAPHMPDILSDFSARLDYYRYNASAKITCNYALHTLCATLLNIRALNKIKKIAHKLFDYLVQQIVSSEMQMSELEIQKIQIAKTEKQADELEIDEETYEEMGEQRDIMDRGTEDPFSMEEADIETTNLGLEEEDFMD